MRIEKIEARQILDSREQGTIQISVLTEKGKFISSAPSGKSKGRFEAKPYSRSLKEDIKFINSLKEKEFLKLRIEQFKDLREVEWIVGNGVGANSLFALESSILKALASEQEQELWEFLSKNRKLKFPIPVGNVIGGGVHTKTTAGKKPDFQEFLIIPRAKRFVDSVFLMRKSHKEIGKILELRKAKGMLNDENAWGASLDNESCLDILGRVREMLEEGAGENIEIGMDIAASTFFSKTYNYKNKKRKLNKNKQIGYISDLADKYELYYLEDPVEEDDFNGFSELRGKTSAMIVGDDLTVTNMTRLKKALQSRSVNAIIVKPNQNGSLLKVKEICDFCRDREIKVVFSHRSGETLDTTIADLALAWKADFIKTGIFGKEREAKLNRLIQIEKNL